MRDLTLPAVVSLLALAVAITGCKKSKDTMKDGTGGTMDMADASKAMLMVNETCPDTVGDDAQQGPCCYRNVPNSQRFDEAPDGTIKLEYRMNWFFTINHPDTLSQTILKAQSKARIEAEAQSMLVRFELQKKDGELAAGPGKVTLGYGRYNCDGTYSFFTDGAAPVLTGTDQEFPGSDNSGRWAPTEMPLHYDPSKTGQDAWQIKFEDRPRGKTYSPFMDDSDYQNPTYDWEIVTENGDIESFPDLNRETMDCAGYRDEATGEWFAEDNELTVYARLDDNSFGDGINILNNISFAQLVAFGVAAADDPLATDRCEPGTADCPWLKLPDSLCPDNKAERDLFACHMGYEGNPDGRETNCSADAPTTVRDENADDDGQCCDPLASPDSGLPACNAYLLANEFVAASAVITKDLTSELPQGCTD